MVLMSNDDGIYASCDYWHYLALPRSWWLRQILEQSGCASALSITTPLHIHQLPSGFMAVNGTPADCIYLSLNELYPETDFDCVITGINLGANLGQDVLFSGTFGAALTAQLFGVPPIATSLVGGGAKGSEQDYL